MLTPTRELCSPLSHGALALAFGTVRGMAALLLNRTGLIVMRRVLLEKSVCHTLKP